MNKHTGYEALSENELIEQLVKAKDGTIQLPIIFEHELWKRYMPEVDANLPQEDLRTLGAKFLQVVNAKEAQFRKNGTV